MTSLLNLKATMLVAGSLIGLSILYFPRAYEMQEICLDKGHAEPRGTSVALVPLWNSGLPASGWNGYLTVGFTVYNPTLQLKGDCRYFAMVYKPRTDGGPTWRYAVSVWIFCEVIPLFALAVAIGFAAKYNADHPPRTVVVPMRPPEP